MAVTLEGDPPIEIATRRGARARRISLRVSRLDGRVTLTVPVGVREAEAVRFAMSREPWLRRVLASTPPRRIPAPGRTLPIEGRELPIVAARIRWAGLDAGAVLVPQGQPAGPPLAQLLKRLARERAEPLVTRHAAAARRRFGRISFRDTRSRWGSCSSDGNLMFSWRLLMAPPHVLDYVVAHEVAHLVHLDHSPSFWLETGRLFPDWRASRDWLRQNGDALQRIDFG
ncbi:M48 family metallopeptidase [Roseitranquillus sediminis]|uniref:M48 family metallopeptidase n=1 Tax=Roseitranquillus sediminis TaxID=2809051 RepID=UPI001D0C455E|nr:SprT family zinc-dependent metalloprotease [Roseitranquillus sediminis]MBM9594940.1 M48 family metallopeptidase [Roseitranquillus sediminis]